MTSYSSGIPRSQGRSIVSDEKWIALLDVGISFVSGFMIYSILGYVAKANDDDSIFTQASVGLVFIALPEAFKSLGGGGIFMGFLLFATLFMLGIDSAFSMVEAT